MCNIVRMNNSDRLVMLFKSLNFYGIGDLSRKVTFISCTLQFLVSERFCKEILVHIEQEEGWREARNTS